VPQPLELRLWILEAPPGLEEQRLQVRARRWEVPELAREQESPEWLSQWLPELRRLAALLLRGAP